MPHPFLYSCVCGADCGAQRGQSLPPSFPFLPACLSLVCRSLTVCVRGCGPLEFHPNSARARLSAARLAVTAKSSRSRERTSWVGHRCV